MGSAREYQQKPQRIFAKNDWVLDGMLVRSYWAMVPVTIVLVFIHYKLWAMVLIYGLFIQVMWPYEVSKRLNLMFGEENTARRDEIWFWIQATAWGHFLIAAASNGGVLVVKPEPPFVLLGVISFVMVFVTQLRQSVRLAKLITVAEEKRLNIENTVTFNFFSFNVPLSAKSFERLKALDRMCDGEEPATGAEPESLAKKVNQLEPSTAPKYGRRKRYH